MSAEAERQAGTVPRKATRMTTTHSMTTQTRIHPDKMRRMAKPRMIQKTYRVPKALYEAAMAQAEEREESLSDVIRSALEEYACICTPSDRLGAQGGHRPGCPAGRSSRGSSQLATGPSPATITPTPTAHEA